MARIKDQKTSIARRYVAVPLMVLSTVLLAAVVYFLHQFTGDQAFIARNESKHLISAYQNADKQYSEITAKLFLQRTPINDSTIVELAESFSQLKQRTTTYIRKNNSITLSLTLIPKIEARENTIDVLNTVNGILRAEDSIGIKLTAFQMCKDKINYSKSAKVVLAALKKCTPLITEAHANAAIFPQDTLIHCGTNKTPRMLLSTQLESHELLVKFYALSSAQKAKEAAATDAEYKASLIKLQSLPSWNYCINVYLQNTAQELGI